MEDLFKPLSLTINKLFTDSDSFYQIPAYQRPYKWGDDQVEQLWDDLWDSYSNSEPNYFLGSLITATPSEQSKYLDIVDGQQRITTLMILFAVIRDRFPNINSDIIANDDNAISIDEIKDSISKNERHKRLRLFTHENHQSDFQNLILDNYCIPDKKPSKKELKSDEQPKFKFMNTAFIFNEKVESVGPDAVGGFINYLYNQVKVIRIDCKSVGFAIKLFQVLNATGLDLTNADLIKSFLLNQIQKDYPEDLHTRTKDQFLQDWIACEQIAIDTNESINSLFVYYEYYLLEANPKKSLYQELELQFKGKDSIKIITDFKKFCNLYKSNIFNAEDSVMYSFQYLRWTTYWKTLILTAYHEDYQSVDEFKVVLRNFYYTHWIAGYTMSKIKQSSFNIIKWLKDKKPINEIKNELAQISEVNTIDSRVTQALSGDVYHDRWIKPLLFVIDNSLEDNPKYHKVSDKNIQIEHILPQKFETVYGWKHIIENEVDGSTLVHKLGNLTLLSGKKNIEASNSSFEDKIMVYDRKGKYELSENIITSFNISQMIIDDYRDSKYVKQWTIEAMADRKSFLINRINGIFGLSIQA